MNRSRRRAQVVPIALVTAYALVLSGCGEAGGRSPAGPSPEVEDGGTDLADATVPIEAGEWLALVRGELATADLVEAQAQHDAVAGGGRDAAIVAGDFAHDPMLGTDLLGTTQDAFLATDRWNDADAMRGFYGDPTFGAAFAELFAGPPTLELFEMRNDFHSWGDLDAADASDPRFFVVVRGRLAVTDVAENRTVHDTVAQAGEDMVRMAGDVAHVVYLRLDDPQEFLAIDVWNGDAAIEAVYGNPEFQAGFAALFEAPPTLGVYRSSGWESW